MQSGIGPMQGQANHFYRCKYHSLLVVKEMLTQLVDAPEKIEYAIKRYQTETKRLYEILNDRLSQQRDLHTSEQPYLVANKYTIADLACFSWVEWSAWAGIDIKPFPEVQKWREAIEKRPAVEKGINVPKKFELREAMKTKEGEEEYAKHHSNWVCRTSYMLH